MAPGPPPPKEDEVGGFLRRYRENNKEAEDLYRIKMEKVIRDTHSFTGQPAFYCISVVSCFISILTHLPISTTVE